MDQDLIVVGGGLAGCEAAWQAANRGVRVALYEMRPVQQTVVHATDLLAEIVCSNSMGSNLPSRAPGLLKEELRRLGSLLMQCADETAVPAGQALAVDRLRFAQAVQDRLTAHPNVRIVREEMQAVPRDRPVILASGPLTSDSLAASLASTLGQEYLYFYDAASPVVSTESLNMDKVFRASRYGRQGDDYINCPLTEEQYQAFWEALVAAETMPAREFEKPKFFEGCLPVEVNGSRGRDTLRFGAMKPVGLVDPRTGQEPYAAVQLRVENLEATMYNLVGFQTRLKWPDQRRVFRMLPGLEEAEFLRYGVMHRNIFINSPTMLDASGEVRGQPGFFLAGCIVGAEGYLECVATGLLCAINATRRLTGEDPLVFPEETCLGALMKYLTASRADTFQPMNVNFGLLPPLQGRVRHKDERARQMAERARESLTRFLGDNPSMLTLESVSV